MTLRILLLTSAPGWGGTAVSYAKIARGLLDRGHSLEVVAAPDVTERLAGLGLPVSALAGRGAPADLATVTARLRRLRAAVVLADTSRDVRLAAVATLLQQARIVYRYNRTSRRARPRLRDRISLSRVAGVVYQSRWIRRDALAYAPSLESKPSWRVPNGYDTERALPRAADGAEFRARHGIAPGAVVALTVAKLTRLKRQEVAMAGLEQLRAGGADVVYVVCGAGAREAGLREIADGLRLPTIFTGLLEPDGVVAALAAADVVVHPSRREIFPNAVGEAMACGRAVVAVDAGGTAELIGRDGSVGLLVPPDDPDAIALAVGALIQDPSRRSAMGQAARRRIETEFPLSRMIDGYERALGEVVGR